MGKRVFDFLGASLGLLFLSPLLVLIAIAVKLSSPGPIFFRQERTGLNFRPFRIIKFRTMREGIDGPLLTASGDRRVTAVGRLLRWAKLDELPQLWNVVKGEMSLVGPRPEIRKYVDKFRADYEIILTVRPGITDEASLMFRREEALLGQSQDPEKFYLETILPKKIELTKSYVRTHSFMNDFMLILRTLVRV